MRDVLWDHSRLYLVMDYLDVDLREHLDTDPSARDLVNVKVCGAGRSSPCVFFCIIFTISWDGGQLADERCQVAAEDKQP